MIFSETKLKASIIGFSIFLIVCAVILSCCMSYEEWCNCRGYTDEELKEEPVPEYIELEHWRYSPENIRELKESYRGDENDTTSVIDSNFVDEP